MNLKNVVGSYMKKAPNVNEYCQRCLKTERWYGNVTLMIVDAAFTSVGLNYFQTVVPKVEKFRKEFVETKKVKVIDDLLKMDDKELEKIWKNKRSWRMAKNIVSYLSEIKKEKKLDDKGAIIYWAKNSSVKNWKDDPVGKINGVGINTFQYLRMMGGVDTVMPDKIVKRVLNEVLSKSNIKIPENDIGFVQLIENIAKDSGYKAIELCWMTWLQSENDTSRIEKHSRNLPKVI
jgi:hypothetical protein